MQVALLRGMKASGRLLVLVQALTSPKLATVDNAAGTIPAPLQVNDFYQYLGKGSVVCMAGCLLMLHVMWTSAERVTKLVMLAGACMGGPGEVLPGR